MSLLDDLRADVLGRLQVTSAIITKIGLKINVGETFTAKFKVKNIDATLSFRNVQLQVSKTAFACPVDGPEQNFDMAAELNPGHTATVNAQFTATEAADRPISPGEPPTGKGIYLEVNEAFAKLEVRADADLASALAGLTKVTTVRTDIQASCP
jgi:hypothetical protein